MGGSEFFKPLDFRVPGLFRQLRCLNSLTTHGPELFGEAPIFATTPWGVALKIEESHGNPHFGPSEIFREPTQLGPKIPRCFPVLGRSVHCTYQYITRRYIYIHIYAHIMHVKNALCMMVSHGISIYIYTYIYIYSHIYTYIASPKKEMGQ
jgi:hypothetical protein